MRKTKYRCTCGGRVVIREQEYRALSRARPNNFALPNELSDGLNMRNISSTGTSPRALLNIIKRDVICHTDNALLMLIIS